MDFGKSVTFAMCLLLLFSCSMQKKISKIEKEKMKAELKLARENDYVPEIKAGKPHRDTLKVKDLEGNEVLIMKAIRDEGSGEMVAADVLDAAVVTARFRNVAERHGKVDIVFQVTVPEEMQDSKWQLRMNPDMFVLDDSVRLEPVVITGREYRKAQLRGYQQYERFLSRIVSDSTKFIDMFQLEIFLRRNLPEIYKFKTDSSYVSDEMFLSFFGVTEQDAIEHYTDHFAVSINNLRKSRKGKMYHKYVKVPIVSEGLRLDTVIRNVNGDFIYNYTQTVNTRPKLRKVDIVLSGDIFEQDKKIYGIPRSEPLTFYISSVSSFVDNTERYRTKVIERRAEANTACYVNFAVGKSDVDESIGENRREIGRIKTNLKDLMQNEVFDLDSIVVAAYASPEGSLQSNVTLSRQRSAGIAKYFDRFMKEYQDSLEREAGFSIGEDGSVTRYKRTKIPFRSTSKGENWAMLDNLVRKDTVMNETQKQMYEDWKEMGYDEDKRETAMHGEPYYKYMREKLYPKLRVVTFDFFLHRKGMVKDTVHTTELDTLYMKGVEAIRDRDYETAITILRPYNDYNAAVAFTAMDYDNSALAILEKLEKTAQVNYMLALLYARKDDEEKAVECYLKSCSQEPSYVHRGNLDPEISALIRKYALNVQEEDDFEYSF